MQQTLIAQSATKWYLIASEGDVVMRVRAGMVLGETQGGELSFELNNAQLKLDIEDDGDLTISSVDDSELQSGNGFSRSHKRLERGVRTEISLPNNVLQLDVDFTSKAPVAERLQVRAQTKEPASVGSSTNPIHRPGSQAPQAELEPKLDESPVRNQLAPKYRAHLTRRFGIATGLVLLCVVGLWLLKITSQGTNEPLASADVESEYSVQNAQELSPVSTADLASGVAPQAIKTLADPIPKPVDAPPIERRSTLETTEPSDAVNPSWTPLATAQQLDSDIETGTETETETETEKELELESKPEVVDTARNDRAAALMLERDLLAAELALAQGRLMTPKQTSAFTLFNRVLKSVPNSSQAKQGLSSIREALINRAFAQLAGASWDAALETLKLAEDAGANASLVADLRGEAAYGRRLADAQVGRFDDLYPFEDLSPISQDPPRVRRYRGPTLDSIDVEFTVSVRGDVLDIEVLGDPPRRLEQAVQRAVDKWRFEPVLYNGRPLPVRTRYRISIPS